MSQSETVLHCGNCNQTTPHRRLSAEEVEEQQTIKQGTKSRILNIVFGVLLGTHRSDTHISYYKCNVCNAEYSDGETLPHGCG